MYFTEPDNAGGLTDPRWDDNGSELPPASAAYDDADPTREGLGDVWLAGVAFLAAVVLRNAVVVAVMVALGWAIARH